VARVLEAMPFPEIKGSSNGSQLNKRLVHMPREKLSPPNSDVTTTEEIFPSRWTTRDQ